MSKRSTRRQAARAQQEGLAGRRHLRATPSMLREPAARASFGRRLALLLAGTLAALLLMCVVGTLTVAASYSEIARNLQPRLAQIQNYQSFSSSYIYDRNGTLLYEFIGSGRRVPVKLADISPLILTATIDVEDASFYENTGVNYVSIARATVANLTKQDVGQGGASTITQQLVRNVVLTKDERENENIYRRKLKEIVLAQELNNEFSKDQILELYLNEIPYGNLSYGIEAAAQGYFKVSARDVNLAQATLLAGLPQVPTLYNPIQYMDANRTIPGIGLPKDVWRDPAYELPNGDDISPPKYRQIDVLRQMVKQGHLTERQARAVAAEDLVFADQDVSLLAPHFVFYVQEYLEQRYGAEVVAEGGLRITTTLDLNMQDMAQTVAYSRIVELNDQNRNIHNAAVVMMQPNTGQILAMVGSIGYNLTKATTTPGEEGNVLDGKVNVTTRQRQPGSALKPFTYLAGMEQFVTTEGAAGLTPGSILWDVPTIFNPGPNEYAPENFDQRSHGPLRARTAVANSLNIPAVRALKMTGIQETLNLLHRMGIAPSSLANDPFYYGLALTLGGGEVTPLDLATAYNTLASGGRYFAPTPILRITNNKGETLEEFKPTPQRQPETDTSKCVVPSAEDYALGQRVPNGTQCVDGRLAYIITNMISDNEARRPIFGLNSVLKLSQPAGVKTGTTNDFRDAWASGFTPFLTVSVWTGNNNNEQTGNVESTTSGGAIWNRIMESVFRTPSMMATLAEPYGGLANMPQAFAKSFPGVSAREVCEIPGGFGGRDSELFVDEMIRTRGQNCDLYEKQTVARTSDGSYCKPVGQGSYPEDSLVTLFVWKLPKVDPSEEKIDLSKWGGFSADTDDDVKVSDVGEFPPCSADQFGPTATPTPDPNAPPAVGPGQILMPNLVGFGENQAREILASLGLRGQVIVDYQGRDRLGAAFDRFPAYAVVSSLPGANTPV
ncbi:MAG TPA: transglycosylase domain-containing protein, partial [Herpetosiphonaceae bacterium]